MCIPVHSDEDTDLDGPYMTQFILLLRQTNIEFLNPIPTYLPWKTQRCSLCCPEKTMANLT